MNQQRLYKIGNDKHEQYLQDDDAFTSYIPQSALDGASLHVNHDAPGLKGPALEQLVGEYREVMSTIEGLSRLYPEEILEQMIYLPALRPEHLNDQVHM